MKLIVISSDSSLPHETKLLTSLFEHGLSTLHLRKPEMNTAELRQFIESIPPHFHNRIIIHSHHRLALVYDLQGIHLTRTHLRRRFRNWIRLTWIRLRRPKLQVTTSFQKLAHIYTDKGKYSYALMGPIYSTMSGRFGSGFNAVSLETALRKNSKVKVVARGGVTADNIAQLHQIGFTGVAFKHSVWEAEQPVEAFLDILRRCRELGIPTE